MSVQLSIRFVHNCSIADMCFWCCKNNYSADDDVNDFGFCWTSINGAAVPATLAVQMCTTSPGPNHAVVEKCTPLSPVSSRTGEAHTLAGTPVVDSVDKLLIRFATTTTATNPFAVLAVLGPLEEIGSTCGFQGHRRRRRHRSVEIH